MNVFTFESRILIDWSDEFIIRFCGKYIKKGIELLASIS